MLVQSPCLVQAWPKYTGGRLIAREMSKTCFCVQKLPGMEESAPLLQLSPAPNNKVRNFTSDCYCKLKICSCKKKTYNTYGIVLVDSLCKWCAFLPCSYTYYQASWRSIEVRGHSRGLPFRTLGLHMWWPVGWPGCGGRVPTAGIQVKGSHKQTFFLFNKVNLLKKRQN